MFTVDYEGLNIDEVLQQAGLEKDGPVQQAVDYAVAAYAMEYWAWDTGNLATSVTGIGTGQLVYTADYASELYYGVRENGQPINYHLDKNPKAGPYPIERMAADHMNDIIEEAQKVVGSKQH